MAIADDISIAVNGDIRYTGAAHGGAGAGYYTVIQFHRFVQDLADDAVAAGNDLLDITTNTPSDRQTDNIIQLLGSYNIDDVLAEHLFDGSIIQGTGGTEVIYDGLVVIASEGMDLQIQQDGAILANDFWNSIPNGETLKGLNRDVANGISHRFMLKVRSAGAAIDGRRIIGQTRVTGKTYSEFKVNGTARGNNVLALTFASDLNDTTDASARTTITNIEGYRLIDVDNNTIPESYYSEWDIDTYTPNQAYERWKYISRQGTVATLYGLNGEVFRGITHEITVDTPTGTFAAFEGVSWSGGTGQMLAIDSPTAPTKMWIQLLTGVAPTDGQVITGVSTATATMNVTIVERTISTPFCGASTGSALIGSYGFGVQAADLSATDKVFDLTNTQVTPPNNVTFSVGGLVSGEDRVLVGPKGAGTTLDSGQFLVNAGITSGATSLVVKLGTEAVGTGTNSETDTPSTGTIRVQGDDGIFHRVTYTGYTVGASTMTFTGLTGAPTAALDNEVFISYIDLDAVATTASFTVVFVAPRDLFIRVRDGGTGKGDTPIKTFETTGSLGSGGGSSTAIRTSDA